MKPATTVGEAAFGPFTTFNRDVWQDDPDWPAGEVYIDRSRAMGANLQGSQPYLRMKRFILRSRDAQRVLLHGQIGSGKSMELRRLTDDQDVRNEKEIVSLSLAERLNLAAEVNIRMVLLALAHELAEHLVQQQSRTVGRLGLALRSDDERILREWLRVLTPPRGLEAPEKLSGTDLVVELHAGLFKKTVELRSDDAIRAQLSSGEPYTPSRLQNLVFALLTHLSSVSGRQVLLVIDDGDKIGDDDAARDVFVRNVRLLLDLPASSIVTVPFWLHFDPDFLAATRGVHRAQLTNVKVISREDPETLAEPGRTFFQALYDKLALRSIIEPAAFDLAARTSGGVPREFIRLLGAGFDLADEQGKATLDVSTLRLALAQVRREMLGFTQDKAVREALARVHRSRRLDGPDDWKLLNALLVVEYTNDEPWYDAHPLLRDDAQRWLDEANG